MYRFSEAAEFGVSKIGLFGSYSTGQPDQASDIESGSIFQTPTTDLSSPFEPTVEPLRPRDHLPHTWSAFFTHHDSLTPVQQQAIPAILAGRDKLVCAPTASGKTEAVIAPLLERWLLESSAARGGEPTPRSSTSAPRARWCAISTKRVRWPREFGSRGRAGQRRREARRSQRVVVHTGRVPFAIFAFRAFEPLRGFVVQTA